MKFGQALIEELEAMNKSFSEAHQRRIKDQTDGGDCFMSEWAEGTMSRINDAKIAILKNKGFGSFFALADLDGNIVSDRLIETRYGSKFNVNGQWINPWIKPENLAKKGFKTTRVNKVAWISNEGHQFPSKFNYWTGKDVN